LQSLLFLVKYISDNHLQEDPEFTWAKRIDIDNTIDFRRVNAETADGPKLKFGDLVPQNARHALNIDRTNDNKAWQDEIET
jgi:hypothetical protein